MFILNLKKYLSNSIVEITNLSILPREMDNQPHLLPKRFEKDKRKRKKGFFLSFFHLSFAFFQIMLPIDGASYTTLLVK